jgi:hypothetical protein
VEALFIVGGIELAVTKTHFKAYVSFFGKRAVPWTGVARTLFIYWLPVAR